MSCHFLETFKRNERFDWVIPYSAEKRNIYHVTC